jgi:hypothetical protein
MSLVRAFETRIPLTYKDGAKTSEVGVMWLEKLFPDGI